MTEVGGLEMINEELECCRARLGTCPIEWPAEVILSWEYLSRLENYKKIFDPEDLRPDSGGLGNQM